MEYEEEVAIDGGPGKASGSSTGVVEVLVEIDQNPEKTKTRNRGLGLFWLLSLRV